jgi:phenylacetate-CoA ligase
MPVGVIEKIYYYLPVILQNVAVSLKGLMLESTRKGRIYREEKEKIIARTSWSTEQFAQYERENFCSMLEHAIMYVPFYRLWWETKKLKIPSQCSLIDIIDVPVITKDKLKSSTGNYISTEKDISKIVKINTTGTTGAPLEVICSRDTRQMNYAFYDAYLTSIGVDPTKKSITIGGRIIVSPNVTKPPFWRYSIFQKKLLMSSYHLNNNNIGSYIKKIESFNPEYIEAYPSSIHTIANYMLENNIRVHCNTIVTSAETLYSEQREVIEKAFSTKVFDHYGCAEMCVFVAQCKYGRYHVRSDFGMLEILDENDMPVDVEKLGRVVCTGFINKVMPFIRYSIGDIAAYSGITHCECGLNTPVLREIYGRADDMLITADGRKIGRMSPVMKGLPVRESQFIQRKIGELDVLIVPEEKYSELSDTDRVIEAVELRMGKDCKVNVYLVDKIQRGKGGKFKSVISKIS